MTLPRSPESKSCDPRECYWFGRYHARALSALEAAKLASIEGNAHRAAVYRGAAREFGTMARESFAKATANAAFY